MRRAATLSLCFAMVVAATAAAQSTAVLTGGKFVKHFYVPNVGDGANAQTATTAIAHFVYPKTTGPAGSFSGEIDIAVGSSVLPDGQVQGNYVVFLPAQVQSISATIHAKMTWISPSWDEQKEPSKYIVNPMYIYLESASGSEQNLRCTYKTDGIFTTKPNTTYVLDSASVSCSWNKLAYDGNNTVHLSSEVDFSVFGADSISGPVPTIRTTFTYAPTDLKVDHIEVVQTTQDLANSVPLVVDKSTIVRVFADTVQTVAGVGGQLRAVRNGTELPGSPIQAVKSITASPLPSRNEANASLNFKLPVEWTKAGPVTLRAEVNPSHSITESDTTNNTKEVVADFKQMPTLAIEYMGVCLDYYNAPKCPSAADFTGVAPSFLTKVFPVASDGVFYQPQRVPEMHWGQQVETAEELDLLMNQLRKNFALTEQEITDGRVQPDQLVAWIRIPVGFGSLRKNIKALDAHSAGGSGRISIVESYLPTVDDVHLAPAIARNYGPRYIGEPGSDWPSSTWSIGEPGFDPQEMVVKDPAQADLMNPDPFYLNWISPFHYRKLFDSKFVPKVLGPVIASVSAAAVTDEAIISGWAMRDGSSSRLDPVIRVTSAVAPQTSTSGTHCLRFGGIAGTLSLVCFDLTFTTPNGTALSRRTFTVRAAWPAGTTFVALMNGQNELARITAGSRAPSVSITAPATGATASGNMTVAWTGSDPDNDTLSYTLLVSGDGGKGWVPIATDLSASSYAVPTAEIKSGNAVMFRVIASDGVNTATATRGPITVTAAPLIEVPYTAALGENAVGTTTTTNLTVANRGEKALTITNARFDNSEFSIGSALPLIVPPLKTAALAVTFRPAAAGLRSATITLTSDDLDHPAVSVALTGAGTYSASPITQSSSTVDFGSIAPGATVDRTITLHNGGVLPVTISSAGSTQPAFTVLEALPVSLAAGGEATFTVRFKPLRSGQQTGTFVFASNGRNSLVTVAANGNATGSAAGCAYSMGAPSIVTSASGGSGTITFNAGVNCVWSISAPLWVTVTPVNGAGTGTLNYSVAPNIGTASRVATVTAAGASVTVLQSAATATSSVIAAVGSLSGGGSFFRTSMQLYNPNPYPISGRATYRKQAVGGSASDAFWTYVVQPLQVLSYSDILPEFGQSGLGSFDLAPSTGPLPMSVVRVYNDGGAAGTTGMTEEQLAPQDALQKGESGVLIAPPNPGTASTASRFNIGIRTIGSEMASLTFEVFDAAGTRRFTTSRSYAPLYFIQQKADDFFGQTLGANDSIRFTVNSGAAVVYGATTDNKTQDPSLQLATNVATLSAVPAAIAVAGSVHGSGGSFFKTTIQLHNPSIFSSSGRLVVHRAATNGADTDASKPYALSPNQTLLLDDIVGSLGLSGLASIDLLPTTGIRPAAVVRVFNDAGVAGTSGLTEPVLPLSAFLQSGVTAVLITPPSRTESRFNVGVRTGPAGAVIDVVTRDAAGAFVKSVRRQYGPNWFEQGSGDIFGGQTLDPSSVLTLTMVSGSAVVYGSSTDNTTNDPSLQLAAPLPLGPPVLDRD